MSARLVGCLCGGPPRRESDYLLWFVTFAILRVCPRCLREFEVSLALQCARANPMVIVCAMNSGIQVPPAFAFEVGHTATATCPGCGATVSVSDQDISAEVMDQAQARVLVADRETVNDIMRAHGIPPVYPEAKDGPTG